MEYATYVYQADVGCIHTGGESGQDRYVLGRPTVDLSVYVWKYPYCWNAATRLPLGKLMDEEKKISPDLSCHER